MNAAAEIVFLFDVDDTLFDNDRLNADLDAHIERGFGTDGRLLYRRHYEALREELGYADYFGAMQRFRLECGDEPRAQDLAAFLLEYPFAEGLYPRALEAIAHLSRFGPTVILSDGDVVLQPRKIDMAGITDAVQGRVLVYVHKETMLDDVARRHPARRYVMFEDKLRVLDAMKRVWHDRLVTAFVRQGHYANDPVTSSAYPPAQIALERIGDLLAFDRRDFLSASDEAAKAGGQTA
ncbi:MAG: haloacid dehalogenase-like hydrolase [Proteobacteria bacterium]|nr:haloacid dehalogenase-like hydrolase [Pseudomonadota bacterium]